MKATTCIPTTDLAQFIHGQLESERLSEIAEHVDACETCQDTVVALADNEDTFAAALREANAESPFEREAALRQGLRRMVTTLRNLGGPASADQTSPHINQIGPYVLEEPLGRGGMGTVYRAVHSKLKRNVAVKLLPEARWSNAVAISRFEREMEAIGQLDHPHIVRASDAGEDQHMHYLVMDFVDGLDLSRLAARLGPLPIADACELARQAAIGLQYVHDNGLVHRDVKPSNLMLAWNRGSSSADGRSGEASLQILDLGLALLGDEHLQDVGELTSVGQLMGTLDYMSPEQGIDSHGVDHRTDIYGLGATLFRLLTGRAPYADPRYGTLMKKMTALATKPAPSVVDFRDDLPQEVVILVDRMLARDPDQRFATAADVADALAPHVENANLTGLLRRGLDTEEPEDQRSIIVSPALAQRANPQQQQAISSEDESNDNGGSRIWWKAVAAASAFAIAGIAYFISTDYGDILVKSDDPDAQLVVKRGNEEVTSLQVNQGEGKTRVRAGNYTVELIGDASGFDVNPQKIDVDRGKMVTIWVREKRLGEQPVTIPQLQPDAKVQIVQLQQQIQEQQNQYAVMVREHEQLTLRLKYLRDAKGAVSEQEVAENALRLDQLQRQLENAQRDLAERQAQQIVASQRINQQHAVDWDENSQNGAGNPLASRAPDPTYNGNNFAGWAQIIKTNREPRMLMSGFQALSILADDASMQSTTAELICRSMRVHGGIHFEPGVWYDDDRHKVVLAGITALLRIGPDHSLDVLAREVKEGNNKSKAFVKMICGLDLKSLKPDRNELRQFRAGLVEHADDFPDGWIPDPIKISMISIDDQLWIEGIDDYGDEPASVGWVRRSLETTANLAVMVRWIVDITIVGDANSEVNSLIERLQAIAAAVKISRQEMPDETALFLEVTVPEDFHARYKLANRLLNKLGVKPDAVFGRSGELLNSHIASIVKLQKQREIRIREDGDGHAGAKAIDDQIEKLRGNILNVKESLNEKIDRILADDFDKQALQQMLPTTPATEVAPPR